MKLTRTHLAASGTAAALGVLAAIALGTADREQAKEAGSAPKAPPVETRTVVVRRTVRVVRHQRRAEAAPKPQPGAAPSASKPQSAPAAPAAAPPAQNVPVSQPTPAPAPKPLETKSSGGSYGSSGEHEAGEDRGEYEDEGGDD